MQRQRTGPVVGDKHERARAFEHTALVVYTMVKIGSGSSEI